MATDQAPASPIYTAAIVGLGRIGAAPASARAHPRLGCVMPHSHMAAVVASSKLKLVAACDTDPGRSEALERDWQEVAADCHLYCDYRELLDRERPDIITVAVPDDRHAEVVMAAAAAGVRGILCEKPIATTLADADAMIASCAARDIALVVNHTRRWHPLHVLARQLVADGAIGKLDYIVARWGGPRAMLFRNGTHLVDAVGFFSGSSPRWVSARLDDESSGHPPRYEGQGGSDPALDPGVTAVIGLESGARALLQISKGAIPVLEYDLMGSEGRIRIGPDVGEIWQRLDSGELAARPLSAPLTTRADTLAALEEMVDLLEGRVQVPTSTAQDARQAVEILVGCLQSNARRGAPVEWPVSDV